jgi:hypothetical protein
MAKGDYVLDPDRDGDLPHIPDTFDPLSLDEDIPLRPERNVMRRAGRPRKDMIASLDVKPPAPYEPPKPRFIEEEQDMSKKDDVAGMVGKELLSGFKAAAKEIAASQVDPSASPLSVVANTISARTIGDLAGQFPTVNMRIRRRNLSTLRWDIIPAPKGIDPKAIAEPGALEDLILNWSGGGEYEIELAAPGTKGFVPIQFTIDAPSVPVPQHRTASFSTIPAQTALDSGIAKYLQQQQPQTEQGGLLKLVEQMLAMQLAQNMSPRPQEQTQNREVEELKRQLLETQANMRLAEERAARDRDRADMLQRMDAIAAKVDAQTQAKPDPMMALLTTLGPALIQKSDSSAQTMAAMMQAVMQQQQSSSTTTLELFKAMNSKPEMEERFGGLVATMGNMAANNMSMITGLMQTGLLDKGGNSPVAEIISQVIGEAADVAKVVFGGMAQAQQQAQGETIEATAQQMPSLPPAQPLSSYAPQPQTVGELPAYEPEDGEEEELEDEVAEQTSDAIERDDDNVYDLKSDGAFNQILMRIESNGDVRDIAVRLYRHGNVAEPTKGHPVAKAWFTDPHVAGKGIMEQLNVPTERAEQIIKAIEALTKYLADGGDLEKYAPLKRKREPRRITSTQATSTQLGEHFDPNTVQRAATNPPAPQEPTGQPEVVEPIKEG